MKRALLSLCLLVVAVASAQQSEEYNVEALGSELLEDFKPPQVGNPGLPSCRSCDHSTSSVPRPDSFCRSRIFGHDIFTSSQLTFEPNLSIATPKNYILGAGDELLIDIWGDAQLSLSEVISPDGRINIERVGPIFLSGLSIEQAEATLRRKLSAIYEGLADGSVKMRLWLGDIRSIQINIMGEVGVAGTYTLPSLATLFHALHKAGGVNDLGGLRAIKLFRDGQLKTQVDIYDYILNGHAEGDIALREGDLIMVTPHHKIVEVVGQVKRPMLYEMRDDESLTNLIAFAGGFTSEANRGVVSVTRREGGNYQSFTVDAAAMEGFELRDGDVVDVGGSLDRYDNRVEIKGAVVREGYYALDDKLRTLTQLIARADGVRDDAFVARAMLYREKPDWSVEVEAIDLAALLAGEREDVELRPNDILVVSSLADIHEEFSVTIFGSVQHPATYPYAENMRVEDLVVMAGGLLESASTANVIITRRIKDPKSQSESDKLFENFSIELRDGLVVDGEKEFILCPFDQVYVRRSPVYVSQSSVTLRGEVVFEGSYPLTHRNMRLSEVVAAAGGLHRGAYVEGAYLLRQMSDEEREQAEALQRMIDAQLSRAQQTGEEEIELEGIKLQGFYSVGINLLEALEEPLSDADVVLRDGDVIYVPKYNGTTRVMGAVLYPNTLTFKQGRGVKYYVRRSGGFDDSARRSRAFVIHMNGMVESGVRAQVCPGSIIVVPSKVKRGEFRWSDVIQGVASTASMAAVVVSAISLSK